ncbi:MAG: MBL fold metallo-hydrolase [Methylococcales bacterium]
MSLFTLEALKAKHGDSLLLTANGATVLIDGGPPGVYNQVLKQKLEELNGEETNPAEIDLMMVSHIDSDHIAGILDLTSDLVDAQEQGTRPLVEILEVWHNSFSDAIANAKHDAKTVQQSAIATASLIDEDPVITEKIHDAKMVLSSVTQGRNLARDIRTLSLDLNWGFKDQLVLRENAQENWVAGDLTLNVIGPSQIELDKLKKDWAEKLPKILKKERSKKARIQAAQSLDNSVYNLASIVVIAQTGDKTMLLTGDARGDKILEWLKAEGYPEGKAHFDVLKLPHHGSDRNVSPEFFEKVTADNYVVCGDGKHGNPEPKTFQMLFDARADDENFKIYMTFSPEELAEHKDYQKHDNDQLLNEILDAKPGRRDKIKFPGVKETSISISV